MGLVESAMFEVGPLRESYWFIMSRGETSCHVVRRNVTWCDFMSHDVTSCHVVWCHITWWDVMSGGVYSIAVSWGPGGQAARLAKQFFFLCKEFYYSKCSETTGDIIKHGLPSRYSPCHVSPLHDHVQFPWQYHLTRLSVTRSREVPLTISLDQVVRYTITCSCPDNLT
jgi:hypothetical protein